MEINVAQLLKEPIGAQRHYHLELEGDEAVYLEDVLRAAGEIRLLRLARSIMVTGKIVALVELACVRCLESFRQEISFDFKEEYYPVVDVSSGVGLTPPEDSTAFRIGPDHVVDLSEALRQYTILAVPMKPVCRDDCHGLCPQCGASLNAGTCRCAVQVPDSRLAALARIKISLGEE